MSELRDGWYQGDKMAHYFDGPRALCNPYIKRGEPLAGEDRRYCGSCKKKLFLRRSSTERSIINTERARTRRDIKSAERDWPTPTASEAKRTR